MRPPKLDFECVSRGEIEHVLASVPGLEPRRILYTPNFAPREEYAWAFEQGVTVTIDNRYVLQNWPQLFAGREVLVRVDTGTGRGHHHARAHRRRALQVRRAARGARRNWRGWQQPRAAASIGLHAHTGSGVFEIASWTETAAIAARGGAAFSGPADHQCRRRAGGAGAPRTSGRSICASSTPRWARCAPRAAGLEFWLEPGRFLVAAAGVLLARVTQTEVQGRHPLRRRHHRHELADPPGAVRRLARDRQSHARWMRPPRSSSTSSGPICESADVLGHDRLLPPTHEGDVLLIANAGAYGRAMSSNYNLRAPAVEVVIL